jgi:murein L,D-transpeptidase YafK
MMRLRPFLLRSSLVVALFAAAAVWQHIGPPRPLPPLAGPVERIVVEKAARRMTVYRDGAAVRVYRVALGFAPEGDKVRQGDGRTPEGTFRIDRRNADSRFHLSLGIDYPQADHLVKARAGGYSPGGDIFIHGQPTGVGSRMRLPYDWTAGCIALMNDEMDELFAVVPIGTPVEILP